MYREMSDAGINISRCVALLMMVLNIMSVDVAAEDKLSTLKETFLNDFLVGVALNSHVFTHRDNVATALVLDQFNLIAPENALKWGSIQRKEGTFTFNRSDAFVEFGSSNRMSIHGHVLVWHRQTPDWVFEDEKGINASRGLLLARMQAHIQTVVGRYKDRIASWDVVNEALEDNGTLRKSKWHEIIGDDFIEQAFTYAHEADPKAKLSYNDYNMVMPGKRQRVLDLIDALNNKGVPIHIVGIQGHWGLDWPSIQDIEQSIVSFADAGVKVMITELDIDVLASVRKPQGDDLSRDDTLKKEPNPYPHELPQDMQRSLAQRYRDLFALFRKHSDKIMSVTFWGATDRYSWLNNWPVKGSTNYPLLFDRNARPKPAFYAVIDIANEQGS